MTDSNARMKEYDCGLLSQCCREHITVGTYVDGHKAYVRPLGLVYCFMFPVILLHRSESVRAESNECTQYEDTRNPEDEDSPAAYVMNMLAKASEEGRSGRGLTGRVSLCSQCRGLCFPSLEDMESRLQREN